MKWIAFFIIFLSLIFSNLNAQQAVLDSLERKIKLVKDPQQRIDIINEIGFAYNVVKPDTAWSINEKAYQEAKKINYIKGMARAAYCKASASFYLGNYDLDIRFTLESLRLYESINDKNGVAVALAGLGISYEYQGQYDLAIEKLQKAGKLAKEIGEIRTLGVSLSNLANAHLKKKNLKQALTLALEAEEILSKFVDKRAYTYTLNSVSNAYMALGDYKNALKYNTKNIEISLQIKELDSYVNALLNEGKIYKGLQDYAMAEKSFRSALTVSRQTHNRYKTKNVSNELAELYLTIGDYKQASEYLKLYALTKDSILTEANAKSIAQMQSFYNIEKKEAENNLLRKQQEFDQANIREKTWLIFSISIFTLMVVIISLILFYQQLEKGKLNDVLKKQNTEIHNQKLELEQQAIELQKLNQTKNKIFSIIGHDLNSPINSLNAMLNLVMGKSLDQDVFLQYLPKLKNAVEGVNFTLQNLLLWANSQMQGFQTNPKSFNLASLVNQNFDLFREIAQNKKITLTSQVEEDLKVMADMDHINLVIRNLINNAIKFTPKGGEVLIQNKLEEDNCVVIVKDTGVGIKPEDIHLLFDKTSQISTYGTANEKGTGLGLVLCKEMIEKNGGEIWAESEVGKGTIFYFTLPLAFTLEEKEFEA